MSSSILKVLTELTALSSSGISILKPFRPWYGLPQWRARTVGLRLLNVQEIESALECISTVAQTAQEQSLKKEILARALWTIDGQSVASKEDLDAYNELHKTELSEVEYRRVFIASFEQYFLDYLYALYTELQNKQVRRVMGVLQCGICKATTATLGPDDRRIKYSTAEYLCGACLKDVLPEDGFEIEVQDVPPQTLYTASSTASTTVAPASVTPTVLTQADFATLDEYKDYLIALADGQGAYETHSAPTV